MSQPPPKPAAATQLKARAGKLRFIPPRSPQLCSDPPWVINSLPALNPTEMQGIPALGCSSDTLKVTERDKVLPQLGDLSLAHTQRAWRGSDVKDQTWKNPTNSHPLTPGINALDPPPSSGCCPQRGGSCRSWPWGGTARGQWGLRAPNPQSSPGQGPGNLQGWSCLENQHGEQEFSVLPSARGWCSGGRPCGTP